MSDNLPPLPSHPEWGWMWTEIEQRAIRAYAAAAVAAEREQCARVCEALEPREHMPGEWLAGWSDGTDDCAAAIRKRGAE